MNQNNLKSWTYTDELNNLLFFAQRMDELLFHYSTDSYRYPVLSLRGLAAEYCSVYEDKNINGKNLDHIIEEFENALKNDVVANKILTKEYSERFVKKYGTWSNKEKFENLLYVGRKLGNHTYYYALVEMLRKCIESNKEKRVIDKYAGVLIRELIDSGYDENYIYKSLHDVFFREIVTGIGSFDNFINCFDFKPKKFDVYIGFSEDISELFPLFEDIRIADMDIALIDISKAPERIKIKRQRTILKFSAIESLDFYSAYDLVKSISSFIVDAHCFYKHRQKAIRTYGQVVDENNNIHTIRLKNLLKYRVTASSQIDSKKNASDLLNVIFSNYENILEISKLTDIHNAAIYAENTSDSLLSLWSILESQCDREDKDCDIIGEVKAKVVPFLKSTYIQKLVNTCKMDVQRWNKQFFDEKIHAIKFGKNDTEKMFAFLAFKEYEEFRKELYALTNTYPLLRNRIFSLNEQLHNTKNIKALIATHTKRIEWHIHRIYRARNYIIHDGTRNNAMNQELVINLHSYVDIMFTKIIELIQSSPYRDTMREAVISHKLAVSIMDEKVEEEENDSISPKNALKYLYYNFEL